MIKGLDFELIERQSINLLTEVMDIFGRNGIKTWIDQGTLLGAVREKKFLDWEDDIDVGVWKDDIEKTRGIWNELRKAGFLVFFQRRIKTVRIERKERILGWRSVDLHPYKVSGSTAIKYFGKPKHPRIRSSFGSVTGLIDTIHESKFGPDLRYKVIKEILDTDHQTSFQIGEPILLSRHGKFGATFARALGRVSSDKMLAASKNLVVQAREQLCIDPIVLETPVSYFKELANLEFLGANVLAPSPAETYLSFKYGEDWQTPKKEWVFYEEDGAIARVSQ